MSNRLAKRSLDLLLKSNHADKPKRNTTEKKSLKIPATKNGLKKIKYELRYGQQQRAKAKLAKQQKKSNPLESLYQEEVALDDNLERNLKILSSQKLKASDIEKEARAELLKFNKRMDYTSRRK
ncbi:hypothetical protein K492DRAFT_205033 [Lichtheimia hyalospora FSU 10163]|nr:hypothetical protein K492DRAFT_205033 [Lichtheimia hyalospora FSU 10163]